MPKKEEVLACKKEDDDATLAERAPGRRCERLGAIVHKQDRRPTLSEGLEHNHCTSNGDIHCGQ